MVLLARAEVHKMDSKENVKRDCDYMTNEEYRDELKKIFDSIDDNQKLRFWYIYINGIEKG